jgi:hypothetical protein
MKILRDDNWRKQIRHNRGTADIRRGVLAGTSLMVFLDRKMRVFARSGKPQRHVSLDAIRLFSRL